MSGIVKSNLDWGVFSTPTIEPNVNELFITLRTLMYYRKRCAFQKGLVTPYLIECIGFIERIIPQDYQNIINLLYNSEQ